MREVHGVPRTRGRPGPAQGGPRARGRQTLVGGSGGWPSCSESCQGLCAGHLWSSWWGPGPGAARVPLSCALCAWLLLARAAGARWSGRHCINCLSRLLPCFPSPLLGRSVDHSTFENLNASLTPKLQSSRSVPHLARLGAPSAVAPGSVEPGGPGLWVGSSQHLRNLGRAVGAKVNDFLRRREASGLGSVGTMEVNRTAEAQLAGAPNGEDDRPALSDAFPRLDPPPPITRKRTPRALKTTQDMLISSQPVLSDLECGTELSPGQPQDSPPTAQPVPTDASQMEAMAEMALPNGEVPLSVPDLLHQEGQEESKLKAPEGSRARPPGPVDRSSLQLSLSPMRLAELPQDSSPRPGARTCSLDGEGPHPDLLSFE
ncbi:uncharacterized protein C1orf226 homolog isoform 5-T5 [Molossus nigricans]